MSRITDEVREIPKHYATLNESMLMHEQRVPMLTDYANGTQQYASITADDVRRWLNQEIEFYPYKISQLELDIKTLEDAYNNDQISESLAEEIDEFLEEESERTHREFMTILNAARIIDAQLSSNYANELYQGLYGVDAPATTVQPEVSPELEIEPEPSLDEALGIAQFDEEAGDDTPEFDDSDDMLLDDFEDIDFDDIDDIPEFIDDEDLEL